MPVSTRPHRTSEGIENIDRTQDLTKRQHAEQIGSQHLDQRIDATPAETEQHQTTPDERTRWQP